VGFNSVGISVAAFDLLHPPLAKTAMAGSALGMLFNSVGVRVDRLARAAPGSQRLNYRVAGMHCTGCQLTIEVHLRSMEGVTHALADYETGEVLVCLREDTSDLALDQRVCGALRELGFQPAGRST
jgi:cation transport ATPase